ncbi:MAG: zinc-binding dehydrogenase, partial [Planctomycetota bacterium]
SILILKAIGIEPICCVGSDWKKEKLLQLGIKNIINYEKENLENRIKEITNGKGVDVVIEHIGGDLFSSAIRCLKRGGILVTCGATRGDPEKFNLRYVFIKQLKICGSMMGSINEFSIGLKIIQNHKIKPVIDSLFSLEEGRKAHKKMEERNIFGKIVLKIT